MAESVAVLPDTSEAALSPRDRAILDFEQRVPSHSGRKDAAIREMLGISPTRYYQLLNTLLDSPAALAAEPALVHRLRRLRDRRMRDRARRTGLSEAVVDVTRG